LAYVSPISDDQADERAQALLAADEGRFGFEPNFTRVLARRPDAYEAWLALNAAIKSTMDLRRYELATIAAARRLRSSYCMLAHGAVLMNGLMEPDAVRAAATDHHSAPLEAVDVAVMDLADKVAADATSVTEQDIQRLRDLGLDDDEILDVVLAATARCFFSKTLDALGIEPDAQYSAMEPGLRDALTVGRPIAAA
jgi:uncharacterized peroxidase-related enzyme